MTRCAPLLLLALLASCSEPRPSQEAEPAPAATGQRPTAPEPKPPPAAEPKAAAGAAPVLPAPEPSTRWETLASGEGASLFLAHAHRGGERALTLFCRARSDDLLVNVPAFRAVGSEERMTFGSGGTAITLVADPAGDRARGGVSGAGPVPSELAAILRGEVAVNYGSQDVGPFAPPPPPLAETFLAGCRD